MNADSRAQLAATLHSGLRRVNLGIAIALGVLLLLTVGFTIADISLRAMGNSLGGSDEISGYVMAIVASWGLGYALIERAHVRIDLLRRRLLGRVRSVLDVSALATTAIVAVVVAWRAWPVLSKSLERGATANTPLETPLWWPQSLWFAGWVLFAVTAIGVVVVTVLYASIDDEAGLESIAGTGAET